MSRSRNWSSVSAPCRLEWRPSRLLAAALVALAVLAALSVLSSEMPRLFAWPLAMLALVAGCRMSRAELQRPRRSLIVFLSDTRAMIDGNEVTAFSLRWRGPIAFMQWRDDGGATGRLLWWPDTLARVHRRELRLAMIARPPAPTADSMAT